jgi:hypothetical protein
MGGNNTSQHTLLCTDIQLALASSPFVKAFRNQAGVAQMKDGSYVRYGLANGISDLLGFKSEVIDSTWYGRRVPVFFGIEVKTGSGRPTAAQTQFIEVVSSMGGYAGVARSVADAWKILGEIR